MEAAHAEKSRLPLTRDRILRAALQIADERGIEALTMRNLGQELGVEAMSLYNHVSNKADVLDGLVDLVVDEVLAIVMAIPPPEDPGDWKPVARRRMLAAREVMLEHRWAPGLLEARKTIPPALVRYYDDLLGLMLGAGFSIDLGHHAMHAFGSRALGFTQELFTEDDHDTSADPAMFAQMAGQYPHITALMRVISHDPDSTIGGCDDQFEFEFGLDLILDGLDRLRLAG
jgi:AcrR family transcriptional regulator